MKTIIRTLDKTGDSVLELEELTGPAAESAKKVFDDWLAKKRTAFQTKRPSGQPDEKLTSFRQIEPGSEVLLVPAIVAG